MKILIILLCFMTAQVTAQQIEFVFPAKGQADISVTPTIEIKALGGLQIDSSSLKPDRPDRDNINHDTITDIYSHAIIDIFDNDIFDYSDSSRLIGRAIGGMGYGPYLDSINYEIQIDKKLYNQKNYGIFISGLRLYDPVTLDTFYIDTLITDYFETTEAPLRLYNTNIYNAEMLTCNDSLFFRMNNKISTLEPGGQNMINLYEVDITIDSLGNRIEALDTVLTSVTLSLDSTTVFVIPQNGFELDKLYQIEFNLGDYTADSTQNLKKNFRLSNYIDMKVFANTNDTVAPKSVRPSLQSPYMSIARNDTISIFTNKIIEGYRFIRWEIFGTNNELLISDSSQQIATIVTNCETPYELLLQAFYEKIPLDTLKLDTIRTVTGAPVAGAFYKVYNFKDSLDEYTYTFYETDEEDELEVCCEFNSSVYQFSHWEGDDEFDDTPLICNRIINGKDIANIINRDIVFGGGVLNDINLMDCDNLTLEIRLRSYAGGVFSSGPYTDGVQNITLTRNGTNIPLIWTNNNPNLSTAIVSVPKNSLYDYSFILNLIPKNCYQVLEYSAQNSPVKPKGKIGGTGEMNYKKFIEQIINGEFVWSLKANGCNAVIDIVMDKKFYYLDFEMEREDLGQFPRWNILSYDVRDATTGYNLQSNKYKVLDSYMEHINSIQSRRRDNLKFDCNQNITINPRIIEPTAGFLFNSWFEGTNYTSEGVSSTPVPYSLPLTFNKNHKAKFIWEVGFRLEYIAIKDLDYNNEYDQIQLNNYRIIQWLGRAQPFPTRAQNSIKLSETGQIKPYPEDNDLYYQEGLIRFYFSRKVKESSLFSHNFHVYDDLDELRFDGKNHVSEYVAYTAALDQSIEIKNSTEDFSISGEYVQFRTRSPAGYSVCYGNELKFELSTDILSTNDESLVADYKFWLKAQRPQFYFELVKYLAFKKDTYLYGDNLKLSIASVYSDKIHNKKGDIIKHEIKDKSLIVPPSNLHYYIAWLQSEWNFSPGQYSFFFDNIAEGANVDLGFVLLEVDRLDALNWFINLVIGYGIKYLVGTVTGVGLAMALAIDIAKRELGIKAEFERDEIWLKGYYDFTPKYATNNQHFLMYKWNDIEFINQQNINNGKLFGRYILR